MTVHASVQAVADQGEVARYGRNAWLVVVGCALALATSSGAVVAFTLSLFIAPFVDEFHWTRTTVSLGFSMMTLSLAITAPLAGRVFDLVGVRRTLLVTIPLFALSLAGFSLIPVSVPAYLALFAAAGVLGAFHSSIPYVKVVSEWFDVGRGLALGITMSGIAFGGIVLTQSARIAMERGGWRAGFVALGAVVLVLGVSAVLFLVRERPAREAASGECSHAPTSFPGATVPEALRDTRFWIIMLFVFSLSMTASSLVATGAAVLTWKGTSASEAATMLALPAITSLFGRLTTGFMLDRLFAPYVAVFICATSLAGMALISFGGGATPAIVGLAAIGFALGAEADIVGYMLSRYCGLRSFGALFGLMVGMFALAPALGMLLLGASFDRTQSYATGMVVFTVAVVLSAVTIVRLGPYKYRPPQH